MLLLFRTAARQTHDAVAVRVASMLEAQKPLLSVILGSLCSRVEKASAAGKSSVEIFRFEGPTRRAPGVGAEGFTVLDLVLGPRHEEDAEALRQAGFLSILDQLSIALQPFVITHRYNAATRMNFVRAHWNFASDAPAPPAESVSV